MSAALQSRALSEQPDSPLSLADLLQEVSLRSGIPLKKDIAAVSRCLPALPDGWHANGDDAAAIPLGDNAEHGYQLLAIEGMQGKFVAEQPWFAGWCSVMVNCSDIAAMGGRPTAVVDALWCDGEQWCRGENSLLSELMRGMTDAAQHLGVPIVGGHTNLRSSEANLAVSILGHAQRLLSAFAARPGQCLVVAMDHRGQFQPGSLNWNAATSAPSVRLRADLELLPAIAEQGLATACKDISQAGLLGTLLMLLESSACGADLDLNRLPVPEGIDLCDWLCAFPSFGYLLTTSAQSVNQLLSCFHGRDISAAVIGDITDGHQLEVSWCGQRHLFYDLGDSGLTGFSG